MKKILAVGLICCPCLWGLAHEYLLLAEKYRLTKGEELQMHLFVADGFNIQVERPFQKTSVKSFELITENATTDLTGTEDQTFPLVKRTVDFDGAGLFHMERNYARISLTTAKFLDYLKEDHIENIASMVDRNKPEQKERYTRYIKSLVQSGNRYQDTLYKKITGQNFELLLMQNPYQLKSNQTFAVKVLFMGKPLANKLITARNRKGSLSVISFNERTNADGVCSFKLSRDGEWVLHATHMIVCPDKTDSDWESFWTSFSFGI